VQLEHDISGVEFEFSSVESDSSRIGRRKDMQIAHAFTSSRSSSLSSSIGGFGMSISRISSKFCFIVSFVLLVVRVCKYHEASTFA
jgi:hypothetical protein